MTNVLFVGGPMDGRQVTLAHLPRVYRCALEPDIVPSGIGGPEGAVHLSPATFEYEALRVPYLSGPTYIYVPADWTTNRRIDPIQRVLTALVRGYVGRA